MKFVFESTSLMLLNKIIYVWALKRGKIGEGEEEGIG